MISELIRLSYLSFFGDGGVRFEPARYFYLNMGVKLVMVKDQSFVRSSDCWSMTVERMLWGSDRYSNPVQMVLEGWLLSIISFGWCLTDFMITFGLATKS